MTTDPLQKDPKTAAASVVDKTVRASSAAAPQSAAAVPIGKEMLVDPEWYSSRNEGFYKELLKEPKLDMARHFVERGQYKGYDPNPFFLLSHYLSQSNYKKRRPDYTPCEDYLRCAGRLRASAHWLFDEEWVQRRQPKLSDAVAKGNWISAYVHFLRQPASLEYAPHLLFNPKYYRGISGIAPEENAFRLFIRRGQYDGLSPHPLFDPKFYVDHYGLSGIGAGLKYESPLHHFIARGLAQGHSPLADFDSDFYLAANPDIAEQVAARKTTAFRHFVEHGQIEGRRPNAYFSPEDYSWYNPSIGEEIRQFGFASPFEHYIAIGPKQRLRASRPLHRVHLPPLAAKGLFEQRARISAQLFCRETLHFRPAANPAISFVLPVWNNFTFTMSILGQLKQAIDASGAAAAEVIVVDNGSTDLTAGLPHYVKGIRIVRVEEQLGYVKACNLGASHATGELLVFLNNDIELSPGIIERIPRSFEDAAVGVCGARIVGATGALQEAGGVLHGDGSCHGLGRGGDPTDPAHLFARDVDYVSGCFLCIRSDLFRRIGGFDERFSPGYYEDTDLCVQARSQGYRVVYDPALVVYHYEYASYSNGRPPHLSGLLMRQHQVKFIEKNAGALRAAAGVPERSGGRLAHDNSPSRRPCRILYIEDRIPLPELGSGFTASVDIVTDLVDSGACVTVWSLHERGEMAFPLWRKGVQTLLPAIGGDATAAAHLASHGDDYDMVWVCRTHNFVALRGALLAWRGAGQHRRLILDTEALGSTRQASLLERVGSPLTEPAILERVRAELPQVEMVDTVITKNALDASVLVRACGKAATVLGFKFNTRKTMPGPEKRSNLLFVGAIYGEDTPNYDSLRWFIVEILPLILAAEPTVKFHVAGYQEKAVEPIATPHADRIVWHGAVADLAPLFDACRVFVAPTRYAGGLPHKLLNAMASGIPGVCTPLLWRQLGDDPQHPSVLSPKQWQPQGFADCVLQLLRDDALWRVQQKRGADYTRRFCSPSLHLATIESLIHD